MIETLDLRWDCLLLDCRLATLRADLPGYGVIENAAIAWKDGIIAFAGPHSGLVDAPEHLAQHVESTNHAWITPGLIDCHTHLVFAANRADEFEQRLHGASYEDIARHGGGIASTVAKTRAISEESLFLQSLPRARTLLQEGVTTIEIKSGYGLESEAECKMLRVARRIGEALGLAVCPTFLGAHAIPVEFRQDRTKYVEQLCEYMLPTIAISGLASAVDGFCEKIAFNTDEIRCIFRKATSLGLRVKLHADQLSDSNGALLAAEFGALSADHLEWTNESGIRAMAAAGTVAVLLPGSFYTLRETRLPPIPWLREHVVTIAVASDLNPGTSPLLSLRQAMNQACVLFRLTPEEALRGITINAARALGLTDRGSLQIGHRADLVIWDIEHPAELAYWMGGNPSRQVYIAGQAMK